MIYNNISFGLLKKWKCYEIIDMWQKKKGFWYNKVTTLIMKEKPFYEKYNRKS